MHKTSLFVIVLLAISLALLASCSSPLQEAAKTPEAATSLVCIYSEQVSDGYRVEFYEDSTVPGLIFTKEIIRDDTKLPDYDWDSSSIEAVYKAMQKPIPAGLTLALIRQRSYFEKCAAMPEQEITQIASVSSSKSISIETDKLGSDFEAWKKKYISKLSSFPDCRRYREVEGKEGHSHFTVDNEHKTRIVFSMRNNRGSIMIQEQKNDFGWNTDWKVLYYEYTDAKMISDGQETIIWTRDASGLRDYHYDLMTDKYIGGHLFAMVGFE